MKHLALLFVLLICGFAVVYFSKHETRKVLSKWTVIALAGILFAVVVSYFLLMVFYTVGSPKLL